MIITQTPIRISFLGGGTDFKQFYEQHEGWVVSSAIDRYIFVAAYWFKNPFLDRPQQLYLNG